MNYVTLIISDFNYTTTQTQILRKKNEKKQY